MAIYPEVVRANSSYSIADRVEMRLVCPECRGRIERTFPEGVSGTGIPDSLQCVDCGARYPVVNGVPRMLAERMRSALNSEFAENAADQAKAATARSFGYEWTRFPQMRDEWERNFNAYMARRGSEFFKGKRVLDAGCGTGRHAYYAAKYGAEVWAVDLGEAVEVARRNTKEVGVNVIQADIYNLPFEEESFDFIYSNGVLHHLPEPECAFHQLLRFLKPGGESQIYLYWAPENQPLKKLMLSVVNAFRKTTTRLPLRVVHALSVPAAALAFLMFVWPYRLMKLVGLKQIAERIPMKQYAKYPFKVCVNDQLDRLSAPIENRYTRAEVEGWLQRAGLEEITVSPNFGWCGSGRKPALSDEELD
jgi:ubiquinone/menaquinone biosynthesis C-methylase UbiE/uncharacterized protein YbaR (Trm112 family)